MTLGTSTTGGIGRIGDASGDERAVLEGMLRGYPQDQLVEEVLIAWQELAGSNDELVSVKQRIRVLELDLAEREDLVAPEVARLNEAETTIQDLEAKNVHLARVLADTQAELASQQSSLSQEERDSMETEVAQLRTLSTDQDEIIGEMEGRISHG